MTTVNTSSPSNVSTAANIYSFVVDTLQCDANWETLSTDLISQTTKTYLKTRLLKDMIADETTQASLLKDQALVHFYAVAL